MKKVIVGILIITIVTGCSSKNNFNIEYENQMNVINLNCSYQTMVETFILIALKI